MRLMIFSMALLISTALQAADQKPHDKDIEERLRCLAWWEVNLTLPPNRDTLTKDIERLETAEGIDPEETEKSKEKFIAAWAKFFQEAKDEGKYREPDAWGDGGDKMYWGNEDLCRRLVESIRAQQQ